MKLHALTIGLLAATTFISGCSLAPAYEKPTVAQPVNDVLNSDALAANGIPKNWQQQFTDPALQALIEKALLHNHDLRVAVLRVEEARGLYRIQRADRLPGVQANANFNRGRNLDPVSGVSAVTETTGVNLGISAFELDFFGRVRNLSAAALANYLATEEAADSARITIVAEVANAWIAERSASQQARLAQQTLDSREATLVITEARYQRGLSSNMELQTDISLTESARAELSSRQQQRQQAQHALQLLTGGFDNLLTEDDTPLADNVIAAVAADAPSQLLERRPDIRQAEQMLRATNANIGAARAAFFPQVTLTGQYGYLSADAADLFEHQTRQWAFTPQLHLPIFQGGRLRANLDVAQTRNHIAVAQYEQTIQQAFREVADGLVTGRSLHEQQQALQRVAAADDERANLARLRYERGISTYNEVLESERSRFTSASQLLEINRQLLSNRVDLYRALGGGAVANES